MITALQYSQSESSLNDARTLNAREAAKALVGGGGSNSHHSSLRASQRGIQNTNVEPHNIRPSGARRGEHKPGDGHMYRQQMYIPNCELEKYHRDGVSGEQGGVRGFKMLERVLKVYCDLR